MENTVRTKGLLAEHGLSFWIDTGEKKILFDTGQGMALLNNARKLNIPIEHTSKLVLSHGHYDHTGGLENVLRLARGVKVYVHPAAFEDKFKCDNKTDGHFIGVPNLRSSEILKSANIVSINGPTQIADGVFVTGEIPRQNHFEDVGGPFFLDRGCSIPDPLRDDQALFIDTPRGVVVLLGCAHSGIVNTLEYIKQISEGRPIHAVMGGMHLINASEERLGYTMEAIAKYDVKCLAPGHCTGPFAMARLWSYFGDKCTTCNVGDIFSF